MSLCQELISVLYGGSWRSVLAVLFGRLCGFSDGRVPGC
jgi:hypothetical protein